MIIGNAFLGKFFWSQNIVDEGSSDVSDEFKLIWMTLTCEARLFPDLISISGISQDLASLYYLPSDIAGMPGHQIHFGMQISETKPKWIK